MANATVPAIAAVTPSTSSGFCVFDVRDSELFVTGHMPRLAAGVG